MADYAKLLALGYDCIRTRHAYYSQLLLLQDHFQCDACLITEEQVRNYLLHLKLNKGCKKSVTVFSLKDLTISFTCALVNLPKILLCIKIPVHSFS